MGPGMRAWGLGCVHAWKGERLADSCMGMHASMHPLLSCMLLLSCALCECGAHGCREASLHDWKCKLGCPTDTWLKPSAAY